MVVVAGAVLWTGYDLYRYFCARPANTSAKAILDSGRIDTLAEECVTDAPIFQGVDVVDPDFVEPPALEEGVVPENGGGVVAPGGPAGPEANPVAGAALRIRDSTERLEVRGSRIVATGRRDAYVRKVLDACKAKFGTPKPTEANTKAVWHFAHGLMKNHGVRPSHIAEMIPYVVQLTFVESEAELRAGVTRGAYKAIIAGRFEEHLSRMERYMLKLKRAFGFSA